MSNRDRWTLCALFAAALVAASPTDAAGQDHGDVPTFLVMPESFPDVEGRAVLLREPGRDIVLLREADATAETLSVALALLRRLNGSTPRREGRGQMVPLTGYVLREALPAARFAQLDAAIARLRGRPARPIGNLGVGRSIPFRDGDG